MHYNSKLSEMEKIGMKPKNIDVIIPVYNASNTLKKCITSLLKQHFDSFNIILIDDGSNDSSSYICDSYKKYDNIYVYHIKNSGRAYARNYGLKVSKSKYIMFVDSDDWVANGFLKEAFDFMKESQNDIGVFNYYIAFNDSRVKIANANYYQNSKINLKKEDAFRGLLDDTIGNYAWNKIYKREVLKNIEYPVGKDFEDLATMYRIFNNANKIGIMNKVLYYYFQRKDSIMHSLSTKVIGDSLEARIELENYIKSNYPTLIKLSHQKLVFNALQYTVYAYREQSFNDMFNQAVQILEQSKIASIPGWKNQLMIFLFNYNKNLFRFIANKTRKK